MRAQEEDPDRRTSLLNALSSKEHTSIQIRPPTENASNNSEFSVVQEQRDTDEEITC